MIDYSGIDRKLERATEHMRDFKAGIETYIMSAPIPLVGKPDLASKREDFFFGELQLVPTQLGLIYGDCIHNVRSALDHLAVALAVDNGFRQNDRRISFPIYDDRDEFASKVRWPYDKSHPLSNAAQEFIEAFQPFKPWDKRSDSDKWILHELHFLDNLDKHRSIIVHPILPTFTLDIEGISIEWADPVTVESNAFLATIAYPPDYDGPRWEPPLTVDVGVEAGYASPRLIPALWFIENILIPRVRDVIVSEAKLRFP